VVLSSLKAGRQLKKKQIKAAPSNLPKVENNKGVTYFMGSLLIFFSASFAQMFYKERLKRG